MVFGPLRGTPGTDLGGGGRAGSGSDTGSNSAVGSGRRGESARDSPSGLKMPRGRISETREFRFDWSMVTAKSNVLPQPLQVTRRSRSMGSTLTSVPQRHDTLWRGRL